jgi:peptide/nickel transport system permease protein
VIIALSFVLAILAYFISPDRTPNANKMTVEIGGEKPGFKMMFVKLKKEESLQTTSFLSGLIMEKQNHIIISPLRDLIKLPTALL